MINWLKLSDPGVPLDFVHGEDAVAIDEVGVIHVAAAGVGPRFRVELGPPAPAALAQRDLPEDLAVRALLGQHVLGPGLRLEVPR